MNFSNIVRGIDTIRKQMRSGGRIADDEGRYRAAINALIRAVDQYENKALSAGEDVDPLRFKMLKRSLSDALTNPAKLNNAWLTAKGIARGWKSASKGLSIRDLTPADRNTVMSVAELRNSIQLALKKMSPNALRTVRNKMKHALRMVKPAVIQHQRGGGSRRSLSLLLQAETYIDSVIEGRATDPVSHMKYALRLIGESEDLLMDAFSDMYTSGKSASKASPRPQEVVKHLEALAKKADALAKAQSRKPMSNMQHGGAASALGRDLGRATNAAGGDYEIGLRLAQIRKALQSHPRFGRDGLDAYYKNLADTTRILVREIKRLKVKAIRTTKSFPHASTYAEWLGYLVNKGCGGTMAITHWKKALNAIKWLSLTDVGLIKEDRDAKEIIQLVVKGKLSVADGKAKLKPIRMKLLRAIRSPR